MKKIAIILILLLAAGASLQAESPTQLSTASGNAIPNPSKALSEHNHSYLSSVNNITKPSSFEPSPELQMPKPAHLSLIGLVLGLAILILFIANSRRDKTTE